MRIVKLVIEHLFPSLIIGFLGYFIWGNSQLIICALFTGWLIDIDHLIDYFLCFGIKFPLKDFFSAKYFIQNRKIIVFLHSWEFVFLWILFCLFLNKKDWALVGAFSWGFHLLMDHKVYDLHPFAYFLSYRIIHKFNITAICKNT